MNAFLLASAADALVVPEPDQEIRAQPDELPRGEDGQPVVPEDEEQHAEHEEVEVGEEAPAARVVRHVAHRVEVDEHADRRDDDQEARGQVVDVEGDVDAELAGGDPLPEEHGRSVLVARGQLVGHHDHRDRPRGDDPEERDEEGETPDPAPEEGGEGEAGDRDRGDERDQDGEGLVAHQITAASCRTRRRAEYGDFDRWRSRSRGRPSLRRRRPPSPRGRSRMRAAGAPG